MQLIWVNVKSRTAEIFFYTLSEAELLIAFGITGTVKV